MSDIDALLAAIEGGGPLGGDKKKKNNKKKGNAKGGKDDAPEDSSSATAPPAEPEASKATSMTAEAKAAAEAAAALAELGISVPTGGDKKTAGKKKKNNKKGDTSAAAAGDGDDDGDDASPAIASPTTGGGVSPAPAAAGKAGGGGGGGGGDKGKPAPKKTAAMLHLERRKAEEERRKAEEEERRRKEEEERRIEEERLRLENEEKERKKDEKRKKVEQLKAEGKYQTKAQKRKAAADRARLDAMRAAGYRIPGTTTSPESDDEDGSGDEDDDEEVGEEVTKTTSDKPARRVPEPQGKSKGGKTDLAPAVAVSSGAGADEAPSGGDDWMLGLAGAADATPNDAVVPVPAEEEPPEDWMDGFTGDFDADGAGGVMMKGSEADAAAAAASASSSSSSRGAALADMLAGLSQEERIERSRERRRLRKETAKAARSGEKLRSPICCVLGHVDTGKTSLLDKIRRTNVQGGEAGGITQQIGATYFPMEKLRQQTDKINKDLKLEYRIPGLLVMDTPGHESFTNLRSRGSSLCDIAVLVVDIMHGLEPQTIESLNLLRRDKTPFVVALNKVDRVYGWEADAGAPVRDSLAKQKSYSVSEFETRTADIIAQFAKQGLNASLYYENDDFKRNVSLVPTSARTGEGIPDLLMLIIQLTQQLMSHRIMFMDYVQCTILEVKEMDGLGTTVDVCLVNGELHEGDTIVVCGMDGPIVTKIRALMTPPPLREIRVRSDFVRHPMIEAAMGIKIVAHDLDKAVAGTNLLVKHIDDDDEDLKLEVMEDLEAIRKNFATESLGVHVQASTLGSLEALLEYLRTTEHPVPVASVAIGPVHRRDVLQVAPMVERRRELAVMLCFDVKVSAEAEAEAEELGVRIFTANIIYHLTDAFEAYMKEWRDKHREDVSKSLAFPCVLRIVPTAVFNTKAPIVMGVDVEDGVLRMGIPVCCVVGVKADGRSPLILELGKVVSVERNGLAVDKVKPGEPAVAIKIEPPSDHLTIMYGRHFDHKNPIYASMSRAAINTLKTEFRDELSKEEWICVKKLKDILGIE